MKLRDIIYLPKSIKYALCLIILLLTGAFVGIHLLGRMEGDASGQNDSIPQWRKNTSKHKQQFYYVEEQKSELFAFDPNTADSTQFLRLGLQPWQIRNIYKYRAKGGVYREKKDFARLYGLTVKKYRELEPYIHISADYRPAAELFANEKKEYERDTMKWTKIERDTLKYPIKLKEGETIALNGVDTTTLKKVPGIGSYYARAIVRYGERLGGYYSKEQLLEIEGFPRKSLAFFTVDPSHIRKLNVNKMTVTQLKRHPYINFYKARAITDYRRMKGEIKSLHDLSDLKEFPPEAIQRLEPYVEY